MRAQWYVAEFLLGELGIGPMYAYDGVPEEWVEEESRLIMHKAYCTSMS